MNQVGILGYKSVRAAHKALGIDVNYVNRLAKKHGIKPREALVMAYNDEPTYKGVHGLRAIAEAHNIEFRMLAIRYRYQKFSIEDSVLSLTDKDHGKKIDEIIYRRVDNKRRAAALKRKYDKYRNGRNMYFVRNPMSEFAFYFTPGCRYPDLMNPLLKQVLGIK